MSLKEKQTPSRLWVLTLSASPSRSALSADAWRQTGPPELPGNKHHLKRTKRYSAALGGGK